MQKGSQVKMDPEELKIAEMIEKNQVSKMTVVELKAFIASKPDL